jgi:hypothetical protein
MWVVTDELLHVGTGIALRNYQYMKTPFFWNITPCSFISINFRRGLWSLSAEEKSNSLEIEGTYTRKERQDSWRPTRHWKAVTCTRADLSMGNYEQE